MPKNPTKIPTLTCQNCDHEWVPRRTDVRRCPRCGSVRWDEEKEKKS